MTVAGARERGQRRALELVAVRRASRPRSRRFHFGLRFALVEGDVMSLPDIRAQFIFPPVRTQGNFSYKEALGELGVPGKVATHRIESVQRDVERYWRTCRAHDRDSIRSARRRAQSGPAESQHEHLRAQGSASGVSGPWRQLSRPRVTLDGTPERRVQSQGHGERQISKWRESPVLPMGAVDGNETRLIVGTDV
jgi:hypothetical protein